MASKIDLKKVRNEAIIGGLINGMINSVINWFSVKDRAPLLLTQNLIDSTEFTVFAGAVPLALTLAFIQTSMAYFKTKVPGKPPYFPTYFFRALRHSIFAFGLVTAFAILLQRFAGSIEVTAVTAAAVSGLVATVVGSIVNFETRKSLFGKA